ncbi:MAG: hypothetical protein ABJA82_14610, partial [Myxococcales bacterium]
MTANPFETETMAELQLRQGHSAEALAIYRRLLARTVDETARERMARRIAALTGKQQTPAAPGVQVRWSRNELTIDWQLPANTATPALEVLLVRTGTGGISTERREIDVQGPAGQLRLAAANLHSVRVAAGSR